MGKTNKTSTKLDKRESDIIDAMLANSPQSFYEFSYLLAKTIKETRIRSGMTQNELSKMSNVNRTTIAKLECHQRLLVNINVIIRLLDSMDLKLCIENKKG